MRAHVKAAAIGLLFVLLSGRAIGDDGEEDAPPPPDPTDTADTSLDNLPSESSQPPPSPQYTGSPPSGPDDDLRWIDADWSVFWVASEQQWYWVRNEITIVIENRTPSVREYDDPGTTPVPVHQDGVNDIITVNGVQEIWDPERQQYFHYSTAAGVQRTDIPDKPQPTAPGLAGSDPIMGNGEFIYHRAFVRYPGFGVPFEFALTYRNQISYQGPAGFGWGHSYQQRIASKPDGTPYCDSSVYYVTDRAERIRFTIDHQDAKSITYIPEGDARLRLLRDRRGSVERGQRARSRSSS